jgi:glycosyltransferase AglD
MAFAESSTRSFDPITVGPEVTARPLDLILTIPVYNEASRLTKCVGTLDAAVRDWGFRTTLIVAEDGSTDGTKELLGSLSTEYSDLVVLSDTERRGRGYALRRAWDHRSADVFAFADADLPAGTDAIRRTILAAANGADIVTSSRYVHGAVTRRPPLREWFSRSYNALVRNLFQDSVYDHQCGVKAFSRKAVSALLEFTREDSWFWDTEVFVVGRRRGLRVKELPVHWTETRYTRTSIPRLVSDVVLHGTGLMRLLVNLGRIPRAFDVGVSHVPESARARQGAEAPAPSVGHRLLREPVGD